MNRFTASFYAHALPDHKDSMDKMSEFYGSREDLYN